MCAVAACASVCVCVCVLGVQQTNNSDVCPGARDGGLAWLHDTMTELLGILLPAGVPDGLSSYGVPAVPQKGAYPTHAVVPI